MFLKGNKCSAKYANQLLKVLENLRMNPSDSKRFIHIVLSKG